MKKPRNLLLVLSLGLLACGRSEPWAAHLIDDAGEASSDAGKPHTADAALEGGEAHDAGQDVGCAEDRWWRLEPRALSRVELVESPELTRLGATDRFIVEVAAASPCERPGRIDVAVMPGNATDFLTVNARAWTRSGDCAPRSDSHRALVAVPGRTHGNFRVVVHDANALGALLLEYQREPCAGSQDCSCSYGTPSGPGELGSECMTDCSCEQGLSCLGYYGLAGPAWSCLRPCADALDCLQGENCPAAVPDGAAYACARGGAECLDDSQCPDDLVCVAGACRPPSGKTGAPCSCDRQCPVGQRCAELEQGAPTCQILCSRDSECPEQRPLCSERSVCER